MMTKKIKFMKFAATMGMLAILASASGCATGMNAFNNRELQAGVKMSDSIFLNPETLAENRNVFVRYTNTSGYNDIELQKLLSEKMQAKGYKVVANPKEAGYFITANLLYMGKQKEGVTAESLLAGGFGGGLLGAAIGANNSNRLGRVAGAGLAGAAVGAAGEALVGSMFKVEQFLGSVDVQIMEPVKGGVEYERIAEGPTSMDSKMGTGKTERGATDMKAYKGLKADRMEYKTRVVAFAQQTNMDEVQVARQLADQLATQITGVF